MNVTKYFSYRYRTITSIYKNGSKFMVSMDKFNNIFQKMKTICGNEHKTKTGPFWGIDEPCYRGE